MEIADVATDRNAIAHALWELFAPDTPPSIGVVMIKAKNKTKNGLDVRRATITTGMLQEIGEKANRLNLAMTPLSQFLTRYRSSQIHRPQIFVQFSYQHEAAKIISKFIVATFPRKDHFAAALQILKFQAVRHY